MYNGKNNGYKLLFLSGILAESCQKRADKARDEAEDLKRNAIMTRYECMRTKTLDKWDSINENTQKALIEMIHTSQNYGKLDAEFCHRIKNNYAPFGLADAKPARLDCDVIELKPFECPEDDHYNPECEKGEEVILAKNHLCKGYINKDFQTENLV